MEQVKKLEKVEYKPTMETLLENTLRQQLLPSKSYLKEFKEYQADMQAYNEWQEKFTNGEVAKNTAPVKPARPALEYDGLNVDNLAIELAKLFPVYASSSIGLPVIYNHESKIYELSQDDLEARLHKYIYVNHIRPNYHELTNNPKIARQLRETIKLMAKNAQADGTNLPFNDKLDPNKIAFKNGTYNFKDDTLKETTAKDYQTTRIEYDYIHNPNHNIVAEWIEYILEEDAKTLFQLIGRIFYRNQDPQAMVFATGEGSNGKSHVMAFIEELVGKSNTSHATLKSLSGNNDKFASSQLFGKMVNIETDMPAQHIKQTGTLKTLSGNDVMSAEYKGLNKFTFTNYALMIFTANQLPTFSDTSHGFLRRIITLPFNKKMSKSNEEDGTWLERSKNFTYDEKSEFISYCIQQYRNVLFGLNGETKGQFYQTKGALRERDQFVESNDTLGSFLRNNNVEFTGDENDFVITKELREAYNAYNIDEEGGKNELSSRAFVPALRAKRQGKYFDTGVKKINGKTVNIIKGIKWYASDNELNNIFG